MPPEFDDDEEIIDGLDRPRRDVAPNVARPDLLAPRRPASVEESQQKRWPDLEKTADTPVPEAPEPVPEPPPPVAKPGPIQDKTERLDDVIAKLRQQSALEAASPPAPAPVPERRPEPMPLPGPERAREIAPPARSAPTGRKLVVYGEPPPPAALSPRPARPTVPAPVPAPAPASGAEGRRTRWISVGSIVAAIVILFALVLWVLISVVKERP